MTAITDRARHAKVMGWIIAALAFAHIPTPGSASANAADSEPSGAAFEAFFWRFESKVFGYLWRMVGDEQSARDLRHC
jgi:hypothetical protein